MRSGINHRTGTTLLVALAAIGAAGLTLLVLPALLVSGPSASLSSTASSEATSVVNKHPIGPARVTTGKGYFEYLAEIEAIDAPLPRGAEYPEGVPEGLDSGNGPTGAVQSGGGRVVARFTWLCAWESEYLAAVAEGNAEREVEAESMLTEWSTSTFYKTSDPDGHWVRAVLDPVRFGDPSGVELDHPQSCAQASIVNVRK